MIQQILLEKIKEELPQTDSLNDAVALALDISYDAAHRRTSLKSKFSLEESILLARHFNISLDGLFGIAENQFLSVEKTRRIASEEDLQLYFENLYRSLLPLLNRKDCQVYYSAKDIPIFYTLKENRLSRFKFYVWLKLLDKSFRNKSFETYIPKLSTVQSAKKLGALYKDLQIAEIWDVTSINGTLKQIHFYYKAAQITLKTALALCEELKILLDEISVKVASKKHPFKLYHNELILMNNNLLVTTPKQQSLYVPFSLLSYYLTSDKETCKQAESYFKKQLKHSKLLNTSGEKDQNLFYNKIMHKIDALKQLILAESVLDFE